MYGCDGVKTIVTLSTRSMRTRNTFRFLQTLNSRAILRRLNEIVIRYGELNEDFKRYLDELANLAHNKIS